MAKPVLPWIASLLHVAPRPLSPASALLQTLFPTMTRRDLALLDQSAATHVLGPGEALYDDFCADSRLYCIVEGELVEHVREGDLRRLGPQSLVGEARWLLRRRPLTLPPELRATQVTAVLSWDYGKLDRLATQRPTLGAALIAGMARSLANPGQLIDPIAAAPIAVSPALKRLQGIAFPSLDAEQFALLHALAEPVDVPTGSILDTRLKLALITAGTVRISRADGHYLDLGEGSLLGELGWAAPDRVGKEYVVIKTTTQVTMLRWSHQQLADLSRTSPRLYAGVVHGIARDVAVKLSLPMQKVRVMEEAKAMSA